MVTLNKPSAGDTNWYQPVTDNWTAIEQQVIAFQGRLQWDSATQVSLQQYIGNSVDVNGLSVALGAGGIALATTDNLISSTGTDSGAAMAASTLYYVYVSNSSASSFASDLRASTTAPLAYNGVKYLGASGNAANWRFVGWLRTNGSTQFVDSDTQRFVVNFYNRIRKRLYSCPGYSDNNAKTTWTTASTTWTSANAGTGSKLEFIANGEDSVFYTGLCMSDAGSVEHRGGVGEGSTTTPAVGVRGLEGAGEIYILPVSKAYVPAEGYAYLELLVGVTSGTGTFVADDGRRGAAADVAATFISAELMI